MKSPVLLLLFFLASCANYVDGFHKQIDKDEKGGSRRQRASRRDDGSSYWRDRFHPERDKRPVQNPVTLGGRAAPQDSVRPPVKRDYRPQRYNANDFKDGGNGGSLWAGEGNSSSLFTFQNNKRTGDIVIINVMENLRNQISSELKRTFPDKPKKKKKSDDDEDGKGKKKTAAAPPTPAPNPADDDVDMKVYDKISGTVMEEISQDYILLRGQKEVIFKKEKRSIEVQALVSRKDIMENDYVNSDKLLESRVFILRERQ